MCLSSHSLWLFNLGNMKLIETWPEPREGTQEDQKRLVEVFGDKLNFDVIVKEDLPLGGIQEVMRSIPEKKPKIVVVFVLTHGRSNGIMWARDREYNFNDVIRRPLTPGKAGPDMTDVPKLFFVQACRGKRNDDTRADGNTDEDRDGDDDADGGSGLPTIPGNSDMLTLFPCVEEYKAYRRDQVGSWMIQTLCKHLEELKEEECIRDVLDKVKRDVAFQVYEQEEPRMSYKQMPEVHDTLLRKLYLKESGFDQVVHEDEQS